MCQICDDRRREKHAAQQAAQEARQAAQEQADVPPSLVDKVKDRMIEGLQRENERLARQAHALNLQLNRTEKELHEAKLAVGHAMNFAILLAKSVK